MPRWLTQRFSRDGGEGEVFHFVPFAQGFALGRQTGDADQPGLVGKREQGQGRHIFAFCSPIINPPQCGCRSLTVLAPAL